MEDKNPEYLSKAKEKGKKNGSVGKGTCHKVQQPEFDPWDPQGGRREWTSTSCPLIATCTPWNIHAHTLDR